MANHNKCILRIGMVDLLVENLDMAAVIKITNGKIIKYNCDYDGKHFLKREKNPGGVSVVIVPNATRLEPSEV